MIDVPVIEGGRVAAILFVHDLAPRRWSREDIAFATGIAERARTAAERAQAEDRLRDNEERLRLIMENARDYAIFTTDTDDRIETWLPGAEAVFGWSVEEAVGQPAAITFRPEDRADLPAKEIEGARKAGRVRSARWHLRKDGSVVFIEGSTTALRTREGKVRGYLKIRQDVTARKVAEERQTLLAREVDHRAKNALAVVQATLRLTPKDDPVTYARAVEGRIAALARAHTMLAAGKWESAALRELIEAELAPFQPTDVAGPDAMPPECRVMIDGPDLALAPDAVQALAMAAHELATNAAKYGALSTPLGRVSVSWKVDCRAGLLFLTWCERGGPVIAEGPTRRGFGSRVIEATVENQLGGSVERHWEEAGLACEITVPIARVLASPGGATVA
jgi:PAS domain S-box-containing protein